MHRLIKKPRLISRLFDSPIRSVATVVFALIIVVGSLWWYFERPSKKATATIPSTVSTATQPANSSTNSPGDKNPSSAGSSITTAPTKTAVGGGSNTSAIGAAPDTPWGSFVSNHHPGNGSPTTETSVCNTTPGASCYIKFTNGAQARTLDAQVANANGSVIWNWDVSNAGFSNGNWQITAIASLSGQTKSVVDPQELVIQ